MRRRDFLIRLIQATLGGLLTSRLSAFSLPEVFTFTQVKHDGDWNPYPQAVNQLLRWLESYTSIQVDRRFPDGRNVIDLERDNFFEYPFLYLIGRRKFTLFSEKTIHRLKIFLENGGVLVIDDALGLTGEEFDLSARDLIKRIFPDRPLLPLSRDHTIYQSYFLIQDFRFGRRLVNRSLLGVEVGGLTPLLYVRNDLQGAWESEKGEWTYECVPYGEIQRRNAFKLGVNIVMYTLCANYKKDQIHYKDIMRKRRARGR